MSVKQSTDRAIAKLVRTRQRVRDHGEVFTPAWLVEAMLDQFKDESKRIDSRVLEPACGSGNFLIQVLTRKLATVEHKYGRSVFEKRNYALLALMCIYGIELLDDNIAECRHNLLEIFDSYLELTPGDALHQAARHVVDQNIVHGDAMTMLNGAGAPITFAEWGYLGKGRFQRRDFRLDVLSQMSVFSEEDSLFSELGRHEVFTPTKTYPGMTIQELIA